MNRHDLPALAAQFLRADGDGRAGFLVAFPSGFEQLRGTAEDLEERPTHGEIPETEASVGRHDIRFTNRLGLGTRAVARCESAR